MSEDFWTKMRRWFCISETPTLQREPYTYKMSSCYGENIKWHSFPDKVVGWVGRTPQSGDYLITRYESGRFGKLKFLNVEQCKNPNDMFFGDVVFVEYLEEESA